MSDIIDVQFDLTPPSPDQLQELVADLTEDERRLLLEHGEEAPFCGVFLTEKREGVYTCCLCGLPVFKGGAKFESGTGWPSFTAPFAEDHLRDIRDTSYGMVRTENRLRPLWRAPGPRLPRRPPAVRGALLHKFGIA